MQPAFKRAFNILNKMNGTPQLILENEADSFAADLEREIDLHDGGTNLFTRQG